MKLIQKVGLLHIVGKKVLMVRSRGRSHFYFPGGKPDPGESDLRALERELREELGVHFLPKTAIPFGRHSALADGQAEPTTVSCILYAGDFIGEPSPRGEVEEMREFPWEQANQLTPLGKKVFTILHENGMI
jgi:8-oxo-dGTP diphosphatase